jgi:hypothetical protein
MIMPKVCAVFRRRNATSLTLLIAASFTVARAQQAQSSQPIETPEVYGMLTYSRGQPVIPAYEGWHPNPDGTIDLWFGYLNQNYREEPEVPLGPDNNISSPYGGGIDFGQPTHFLPRNNRWVFKVRVPKDFGDKEVVWTITSHGRTYRAYATLNPSYVHDDMGMQREFNIDPPAVENKPPNIHIEGDDHRAVKVGDPVVFTVMATDDGVPKPTGARGGGPPGGAPPGRGRPGDPGSARPAQNPSLCEERNPQSCGEPNEGAGFLFSVKGLRMGCFVYRGGSAVKFDPPQPKMWEDHRGASPWASGYVLPPIPKDNKWTVQTTFKEPGTYVVRCLAQDGFLQTPADVSFTVTR